MQPTDVHHEKSRTEQQAANVPKRESPRVRHAKRQRQSSDDIYIEHNVGRLLEVVQAAKEGDFTVRMEIATNGTFGALASSVNELRLIAGV